MTKRYKVTGYKNGFPKEEMMTTEKLLKFTINSFKMNGFVVITEEQDKEQEK